MKQAFATVTEGIDVIESTDQEKVVHRRRLVDALIVKAEVLMEVRHSSGTTADYGYVRGLLRRAREIVLALKFYDKLGKEDQKTMNRIDAIQTKLESMDTGF